MPHLMNRTNGIVVTGICGVCEDPLTRSVLSEVRIESFGATIPAMAHVGPKGHIHLHRVVIAPADALTVRYAVRRWCRNTQRRLLGKPSGVRIDTGSDGWLRSKRI